MRTDTIVDAIQKIKGLMERWPEVEPVIKAFHVEGSMAPSIACTKCSEQFPRGRSPLDPSRTRGPAAACSTPMEFSFRPRNASGRPQLLALLSAQNVEVFAQKEAYVLILGNVSATPSGPVETLPACSREARLRSGKRESGFGKIIS
jgi:hypothetical protein